MFFHQFNKWIYFYIYSLLDNCSSAKNHNKGWSCSYVLQLSRDIESITQFQSGSTVRTNTRAFTTFINAPCEKSRLSGDNYL